MRVPVSWLRDYAAVPESVTTEELAARLTAFDLKLEEIDAAGAGVRGPVVVARVLSAEKEQHSNGKTVNWCQVDVGEDEPRGIVCGAHNFGPGDLVVASLPGAVLPGGFAIAARKTYGHVSDGMICSPAELGLTGDSSGIIVLAPGEAQVGDDALALLGVREDVLDLEVNPDRAYALSMRGVGRDAALALGVEFRDPADVPTTDDGSESYPVRVEDPTACPVFVARTVTGFDPSRPTPRWMARRIELAGMRPISLAVDVTNYVMLELGQPIHGYDRAKLQGDIVVRRATAGEKLTTLDGVVRSLGEADLLITDDRGPIGLAGIMGGEDLEMSATTTDIVIEAAHFDPPMIARTARTHRLPSEASKRFERGVDPLLPRRAAERVAALLAEHGGGAIEDGVTVVGEAPGRQPVTVPAGLAARVAGVRIDVSATVTALEANGCEVVVDDDHVITVTPPSWRFDLIDPNDIAEEVLRVIGYDQVPSVLPQAQVGRGLTKAQRLRRRAGFVLAGDGLVEVKSFPFAGTADWDRLDLPADDPRRRQVMLENPLSAEEPGMITTLLPGLLKTLALNVGRGHADVQIWETGRVYLPKDGSPVAPIYGVDRPPTPDELAALDNALPDQPYHIGLVLAGERRRSGWAGKGVAVTWADPIAIARHLAAELHVDLEVTSASYAPWHPGRCAALSLDGVVVGHAGELHPRVLRAWGLPARTVAAEIDLDALVAAAPELGPRPSFSTFPVAKEDLALVVGADVPSAVVQDALVGASSLIESVRLFDVYTGDQVPEGHKSLAFAVRLRAPDRTLTDDDITAVREAAVVAASTIAGATLRS